MNQRIYLTLLIAAALACRLVLAAGDEVITNDSASYLRLAENLAERGAYTGIQGDPELKFPPGYPGLIAAAVWLGVPLEWAGRLVTAAAGALLVLPCFVLGRRLGGDATAWTAAILAAFSPPFVYAGSLAIAEVPFALFALGAVALLAAPGIRRALAAGGLLGLANLVKPEAFAFLAVAMVAAALFNREGRLRVMTAVIAGFVLVTGPWIAFLNAHVDPVLLEGKSGMYGAVCRRLGSGMTYGAAAAGIDGGGPGPLVRFNLSVGKFLYSQELLAAPRAFAACWIRNAERIIDVTAREAYVHPLILLAAAVGSVRALLEGGSSARVAALVLLAAMATTAHVLSGMVTMWIAPRYLLPALALATILAAHGIARLRPLRLPATEGHRGRVLLGWLLLGVGLMWWADDLPHAFGEKLPVSEREVRTAIAADAAGRRPLIMSQFALAPFYSASDWIQTPVGNATDVVRYARSQGVTHLITSGSAPASIAEATKRPDSFGLRIVPAPEAGPDTVVLAFERDGIADADAGVADGGVPTAIHRPRLED